MRIRAEDLKSLVAEVFARLGSQPFEQTRIAQSLVDANLAGHDSHGVIRVASYVEWLRAGKVAANQHLAVVHQSEVLAVVDGQFGFGQVIGWEATELGIKLAGQQGVAVIALRNAGHLGRIGEWAEQAAARGLVSLHFVNTSGGGILVAPQGGIDRRLSANPIAAGVPRAGLPPLVIDISTCTIAEGKIRVALNAGKQVPPGAILDADGRPTTDPNVFYATPPGAILPMAAHKGYALGVLAEVLAGALTGGRCSHPGVDRVANGMLSIYLDPSRFTGQDPFTDEIKQFAAWVKSARPATPGEAILLPGEPEQRTRAERLRAGIELDETTWKQLCDTARNVGVTEALLTPSQAGR